MSAQDLLLPPDDHNIEKAVKHACSFLRRRYGKSLTGIFLFGSRARGDYEPFSDINIAAVIAADTSSQDAWDAFVDLEYDLLIETGAEVHVRLLREAEWREPQRHAEPRLVRKIQREAIDLLTVFWEESPSVVTQIGKGEGA